MGSKEGLTLRQQALGELEKSTKTLEVAFKLLKQGNHAEADRLLNEARTQRTISALLMAEANHLETDSRSVRSQYREPARFPQVRH